MESGLRRGLKILLGIWLASGLITLSLQASDWISLGTAGSPPTAREQHTAVWTGTEMLIFGGFNSGTVLGDGGRYSPTSDAWVPLAAENRPSPRWYHGSTWTGNRMLTWGGWNTATGSPLNTGALYDPNIDSWVTMSSTGAPSPRGLFAYAWTGNEFIVWGGGNQEGGITYGNGARYNPSTDTWTAMSSTGAPSARVQSAFAWTGAEFLVWGGVNESGFLGDGALYNPATDSWRPVSTLTAPSPRRLPEFVFTPAGELIVWAGVGGSDPGTALGDGGIYDVAADTWKPIPATPGLAARHMATMIGTGFDVLLLGGSATEQHAQPPLSDFYRFIPDTVQWEALPVLPRGRRNHSIVWTGSQVIAWGGVTGSGPTSTGYRFDVVHQIPDGFNPGANGPVRVVISQPDTKIVVTGEFTSVSGATRNSIARLDASGALDLGFNPSANNGIITVCLQDDLQWILGGNFSTIAGATRSRLARISNNGAIDPTFTTGLNRHIFNLAILRDRKIALGGDFTTVGGSSRNYVGILSANGSIDPSLAIGANYWVRSLTEQSDGKLLVGGGFTTIAATTRQRLARFNVDRTLDTSFVPAADGWVFCIAVQADGKILIGGEFTTVNGTPRNRVARLNPNGSLDVDYDPNADGTVTSLALQADGSVVGGEFMTVGGMSRPRLARILPSGALDSTFKPAADGAVTSLALQPNGKLLLGGDFTHVDSAVRNRIARLINNVPAIQRLIVPDRTQILWTRCGSTPEVDQVIFESWDGSQWSTIATPVRVPGGWQATSINIPSTALQIRARGRATGGFLNGSSTIIEETLVLPSYPPDYRLIGLRQDTSEVVEINPLTGVLTHLLTLPFSASWRNGLDYNPSDGSLYVTNPEQSGKAGFYRLDLTAGTATRVKDIPGLGDDGSLESIGFTTGGDVFAYDERSAFSTGTFYSLSWATGAIQSLGSTNTPSVLGGDYDPIRNVFWASDEWNGKVYQLNVANSSRIWTSTDTWYAGSANASLLDMDVTPDGEILVGAQEGTQFHILQVNPSTGTLTRKVTIVGAPELRIASIPNGSFPSIITLDNSAVIENNLPGALIGTLSTIPPDSGIPVFAMSAGAGDTDNTSFLINDNQLTINNSANFETKSSYSIRIRATDSGNPALSFEKTFTITVTDLNEAPSAVALSNSQVAENGGSNALIGTFTATDPDPANTHAFLLIAGSGDADNAAFTINGNQLRLNASANFEVKPFYSIRLRASDNGSPAMNAESTFMITVTDVSQLPIRIRGNAVDIANGDADPSPDNFTEFPSADVFTDDPQRRDRGCAAPHRNAPHFNIRRTCRRLFRHCSAS